MHRKIISSFGHAIRGIRAAWVDGWNFRIQIVAGIALGIFIVYFHFSYLESVPIVIAATFVLFGELVNTAVEGLLDVVEPEHHPTVGKIKDMVAGAVLIASIGAVIIGVLTFVHHFLI